MTIQSENNNEHEVYALKIKEQEKEEQKAQVVEPIKQSKYHEFRHFMYTHLQNKWVKTIVVACLAAGVIYLLEILYKAVTK